MFTMGGPITVGTSSRCYQRFYLVYTVLCLSQLKCTKIWTNKAMLTSTILLAQVGKSPDITQTHREAHLGEDVLQLVVPGRSAVLSVGVWGGQQGLSWSSRARTQAHAHLAALIVHGVLEWQQVSHRLCDWLSAVLPLGHLGVLWHGATQELCVRRTKVVEAWRSEPDDWLEGDQICEEKQLQRERKCTVGG